MPIQPIERSSTTSTMIAFTLLKSRPAIVDGTATRITMPATTPMNPSTRTVPSTDQCWRASDNGRSPGIKGVDIVPRKSGSRSLVQDDGRARAQKRAIGYRVFEPPHTGDEQEQRDRAAEKD